MIFHEKIDYQKVIRLKTWVVESSSVLDFRKIWLKISERMKFQVDPITGWVGTIWLSLAGPQNLRFKTPYDMVHIIFNKAFIKSNVEPKKSSLSKNMIIWNCFFIHLWFLKMRILLTSKTQPSCSNSTGYYINLKLHAVTYFEPYFTKIQDRTWFDHPCL